MTTGKLCALSGCNEDGLYRLLKVLKRMELIGESEGIWFNSQSARRYLVAEEPFLHGGFFSLPPRHAGKFSPSDAENLPE